MKQYLLALVLSLALIGCGTLTGQNKGTIGKASKAEEKQKAKIEMVDDNLALKANEKLDYVGQFAAGTDYALAKSTNAEPSTKIAKDINQRVISLANKPSIEQVKEIQAMVDGLMENNKKAAKILQQKDEDISALQDEEKLLVQQKNVEIKKYMAIAAQNASLTDQYKQTLQQMDSFFGLGAVKYGLTKFIKTSFWFILGFGILFVVLRIFATANPIAESGIFSVFESILGAVIKAIGFLAPKAIQFAGLVGQKAFDTTSETLSKMVKVVEDARTIEKSTGLAVSAGSLKVAMAETMDQTHKDVIDQIKVDMGGTSTIPVDSINISSTVPNCAVNNSESVTPAV